MGKKKKGTAGSREYFVASLLKKEGIHNKHLMDNIIQVFKKTVKSQEIGKCWICKKSWNVDEKEYKLNFLKKI